MFLKDGPLFRCLASLHRVRSEIRSPTSTVLSRHCDSLFLISLHFVSFVPRLPQIAHVLQFALDADMCIHCIEPGACSTGDSIPGFFVEETGPPKFLGSLLYSFAMLTRPRSDGTFLTKTKRPCCPHAFKDEGSNKSTFEAQSHRFRIRCGHRAQLGRLRNAGYPKHHARLAPGCWLSSTRRDLHP